MDMAHVQNQIQRINTAYGVQPPPPDNNPRQMVDLSQGLGVPGPPFDNPQLRSSKSKLNFESAKEMDQNFNSPQKPPSGGFLQIGQDNINEKRREIEKKERQAEYQEFLKKQ